MTALYQLALVDNSRDPLVALRAGAALLADDGALGTVTPMGVMCGEACIARHCGCPDSSAS